MYKLSKYTQNLTIRGNQVWSFATHVATISNDKLYQLGRFSKTTQNHINYVAEIFELSIV